MAKTETTALMSPEFRVSFPHVFKPQEAMEAGKEPRYGITMLFAANTDLAALKAEAAKAAQDFFGDKLKDPNFAKRLRTPFRDQGEKPDLEGYVSGSVFMNATSKMKPGLVDENVQPIIDESQFYAGCYARATLRFFGYDQKGNVGVGCGVNNIQKLRDGESLGGRARPEAEFKPVAGAAAPAGAAATALFA